MSGFISIETRLFMLTQYKSVLVAVLFIGSVLFSTAAIAQDASLDEIIEAHVKAVGGKEAISKVDNVERKAKVTLEGAFGSMSGESEEISDIKGKRYYNNLDLGQYKKTQAMSGDSGWVKGTEGDGEMSAQDIAFAQMSLGVSPLLSAYETARGLLKVKGTEKFGDNDCHVVAVGSDIEYFVGTKSSLLEGLKISGLGTMVMSNYKEFDGVQFPVKQSMNIEAQRVKVNYRFRSTNINVEVDDSLFGDLEGPEESKGAEFTPEQIMGFMDKDGDGKISKQEAKASPEMAPAFAYIDTSRDGFIDMAEVKAMVEYTKAQGQGKRQSEMPKGEKVTAKQVIASMDKNGDGKISKQEANEELKLFFSEVDANKDGFVDEKEGQAIADSVNNR